MAMYNDMDNENKDEVKKQINENIIRIITLILTWLNKCY